MLPAITAINRFSSVRVNIDRLNMMTIKVKQIILRTFEMEKKSLENYLNFTDLSHRLKTYS